MDGFFGLAHSDGSPDSHRLEGRKPPGDRGSDSSAPSSSCRAGASRSKVLTSTSTAIPMQSMGISFTNGRPTRSYGFLSAPDGRIARPLDRWSMGRRSRIADGMARARRSDGSPRSDAASGRWRSAKSSSRPARRASGLDFDPAGLSWRFNAPLQALLRRSRLFCSTPGRPQARLDSTILPDNSKMRP